MLGKRLEQKIAWSTFVQVFGKAVQMVLGYLAVKWVTNALGQEDYGFYGKIMEFSLFFSTAGNLGLFGNIVRKMAENPSSEIFWNAFLLRIFTALGFLGIGVGYAAFAISDPIFLFSTLLFMSSLFLDHLTTVCDAAFQATYQMGRATLALIAGRATNLLTLLGLTQFFHFAPGETHAIPWFFLAPLLASLVTVGLSLFFLKQKMPLIANFNSTVQKDLLWTSLPFGIINLLNNIYYRFLPSALIAKVLTTESFGSYSLALHLSSVLALFSTFLMFSILPSLKQALHEKRFHTAKELYKKAKWSLGLLGLCIVTGGSIFGPWALSQVSSHDFLSPELWLLFPMLLVLAAVSYFYDLSLITLFALNKDRWWLKRELLVLPLSLVLSGLSFLPTHTETRIVLILSAAILAEATIAALGMKKIKELISL